MPLDSRAITTSPSLIFDPSIILSLSTIPTILDVKIYVPGFNTPGCSEVSPPVNTHSCFLQASATLLTILQLEQK